MKSINWNDYTAPDFQQFCNTFLSFEFGKTFQPFNAQGQDNGIDGKFIGQYEGKSGEWRFQYKFHLTARRTGVQALKKEIKSEAGKLKAETEFVLLTNVELLPQEQQELLAMFQQNKPASSSAICEIWDGAKIHSLSLRYPLLWLWLEDGFSNAQLVDYRNAFGKLLSGSIDDLFTFTNKFACREDKIEELKLFVESEHQVCLITGEAGIGKTRLVIELFKQYEFSDEIICLALITKHIDFDKLAKALAGSKIILLLVDDAHEYDPKTISDLNQLVNQSKGSAKLILTAREIQSHNSIQLIKEYERVNIQRIKLDVLSREQTMNLFKSELTNNFYRNFVSELTTITHGRPILIVAVLKAAHNGMLIEQVKTDDLLNGYVENYFDLFIAELNKETGVEKLKAKKLLRLVCLLEPFSFTDIELVKKMAAFIKTDEDNISCALNMLIERSFVSGRWEQSIKPDYYSDILLKQADRDFTEKAVEHFGERIQNIISNLASADDSKKSTNSLLDEILYKYIKPIGYSTNSIEVAGILDTVDNISYFKTEIARKTVEYYLTGLKNKQGAVYADFENTERYNTFGGSSLIEKIKAILSQLLYDEQSFVFVYKTVFELSEIFTEAKVLKTVFQFARRDAIEHFRSIRQFFFVKKVKKEFTFFTKEKQLFAIECLKSFFIHDFNSAVAAGPNRDSITITTYYIPSSAEIKQLRKEVIELFIEIYRTTIDESIRTIVLEELLDIPRGISATSRNSIKYDGDDEIKIVLEFVRDEAFSVPQAAQKDILDRLFWFKQWKINEVFFPLLDEIKEQMIPRNLAEELIRLFAQSENRYDYDKAKEDIKISLRRIYQTTEAKKVAEGLSSVYNSYVNNLYNFHFGITTLAFEFHELAMAVYDELWSINRVLIYHYGYIILNAVRFEFQEEVFFWKRIELLQCEASVDADNMLLYVYGVKQAKMMIVTDRDLDVIAAIANKKVQQNNFSLARPLVVCVVHKPELGLSLGRDYLLRSNNQEADHFFLFLFDNIDACYETMRTLSLEGTLRYELAYNMERCLNAVFKEEGESAIFDYIMKRIELKRNMFKLDSRYFSYELLPDGKHAHLLDDIDDNLRTRIYGRFVDWYCQNTFVYMEVLFLDNVFKFFNRVEYLTEPVSEVLHSILKERATDTNSLIRLLEILQVYHDKNDLLISLVEEIYVAALKNGIDEEVQRNDIYFKTYQALTNVGVKSGTVGQPFHVDIHLKELLEQYQAKISKNSPFYEIVQNAIQSTQRAIDDSYDRGNETW